MLGGDENVLELNSGDGRTILWYIKGNWILKGEKLKVLSHSLLKYLNCQYTTGREIFIAFNSVPFQNHSLKVPPSSDFSKPHPLRSVLWSCYICYEVLLGSHQSWFKFNLKTYFKLLKWYETEHTLRCITIYQFSVLCIPNVNSHFQVTSFCFAYMPWNQVFHVISLYIFRQLSNVSLSLAVLEKQ